ncbi:MAG TPA: magnesium/cobalt transporter CorA [Spirochaetia bacterium]|nr:magnesium/cobalt transporter CorA [Spirochaetia bacterium]
MKNTARKRKQKKRVGLPPGTLIPVAEGAYQPSTKTLFEYDKDTCDERTLSGKLELDSIKDPSKVSWLNIDGIQDSPILEQIGLVFHVHSLVLEDIQNPDHRPKIEDYEDYTFMSFKMLTWDEENEGTMTEQVSLILGKGYVISFQERVGDVFNPVRERLRSGKGRLRKQGADYLAYTLVDAVVDNYFAVLEKLEDQFELIEDQVVYRSSLDSVPRIHDLRGQAVLFRRAVWPLRENLHEILKGEHELIEESTQIFFRDVYDHVLEVVDTIELYRETLAGLLNFHQSNLSKQLNSTMKVLTIISTIFIPPTFLVGVYGMNFHFMPELSWKWGYFALWALMLLIAAGMVWFFKRKKWF